MTFVVILSGMNPINVKVLVKRFDCVSFAEMYTHTHFFL